MIVYLPCHAGDQDKAYGLLNWIAELGIVHAKAAVYCATDCDISSLVRAGKQAFTEFIHITDSENHKSNWSTDAPGSRDATGPNSMFRNIAWTQFVPTPKGPWLFLEPDCLPLVPDWYDQLWQEYQQAGKPVMGDYIPKETPHLSGTSIYPEDLPARFGKMIHNVQGAFDVSAATEVLSQAHITKRIQDCWRTIINEDSFSKIRPEAVLFCGVKNPEAMIPMIRRKLNMKGGDAVCTAQSTAGATLIKVAPHAPMVERQGDGAVKFNPSSAPVVDIYLKTYLKDYLLANYCLKSIAMFVTGYRQIIIEAPEHGGNTGGERSTEANCLAIPHKLEGKMKLVNAADRAPGYIDQQAKKLGAFKHTDADYLLYVDSDCCFQRTFDVSEMFKDGKSTWQYTPFTEARPDQQGAWQPVMTKFLGKPSPNEFMRRHPHVLPRWLPEEMDKFCRYRHGMSLDEYIMAQGDPAKPLQLSFSEFNCAGFFAWEFFKDRIAWVTDAEATPAPLVQGFTWGGDQRIKDDIAQFERILGEECQIEAIWPDVIGSGQGVSSTPFTLDSAVEFLRIEAVKSPLHKARLMKRITAALGTQKKPEAPKRRRGRPKNKAGAGNLEMDMKAILSLPEDRKGFLLCIHTYPGANQALDRHWPQFKSAGADHIVVITTELGGCILPDGVEFKAIGPDSYINGPILPKRLADTLRFCLDSKYDQYVIAEYDTIILKPLKPDGLMLHNTGGQLPGAAAPRFHHNPWIFDRESAISIAIEIDRDAKDGIYAQGRHECSPDVALGLAVSRAGLSQSYKPINNMYTRNSLSEGGALEEAVKAVRNGCTIVHGCKTKEQYEALMEAAK